MRAGFLLLMTAFLPALAFSQAEPPLSERKIESSSPQQPLPTASPEIKPTITPTETGSEPKGLDWKFWSDLAIKILNVGVVVYIFRSGRKERQDDVHRKKYYFWFQDLLIKGGKPHLDTFFQELDELCDAHAKSMASCTSKTTLAGYQKKVSETHLKFNRSKREFDKKFVNLLYVVTPELGQKIDQMLMDLQDCFAEKIQVSTGNAYSPAPLETLISDFKRDVLGSLFSWKVDL